MGFNTVAVLLNDFSHELETDPTIGPKIADAIRSFHDRERDSLAGWFHAGQVISQAHADYHQIVIVHGNTGQTIYEANDLPYIALDAMADCLKRHGWSAKPPSRKRTAKSKGTAHD